MFAAVIGQMYPAGCFSQEIRIPIDEDARVDMITPEMRSELGLFPETAKFRSAGLFRNQDSLYILIIESNTETGIVRQRNIISQSEMIDLRKHVTQKLRQTDPSQYLKREGRVGLITGVTTLSLGFSGFAMPAILQTRSGRQSTGAYLITAGAGFLAPYFITKNMDITNGMTTLGLHGGMRGIADGALFYWLIKGDTENWDDQALFSSMMVASVGELLAGTSIASSTNMEDGQASTLSTMGLFGGGIGFAAYGLAGSEGDISGPLLVFGGSALGYGAGLLMTNNQYYTPGDAQVLSVSGPNGVMLALTLTLAFDPDEERLYYGTAIAGALGGLIVGNELVRGKDFTTADAVYIGLGASGGYLVGSALGVMASPKDGKVVAIASAIGGSVGFALMAGKFSRVARSRALDAGHASSWNIEFSPAGMASALGCAGFDSVPLPLARFSYTW